MERVSSNAEGQVIPGEIQNFIEQYNEDDDFFRQFFHFPNDEQPPYVQPSIDGRDDTSTYLGSEGQAKRAPSQNMFDSAHGVSSSRPLLASAGALPSWQSGTSKRSNLSWLLNDEPAPAPPAPKRVDERARGEDLPCILVCPTCRQTVRTESELKKHKQKHEKPYRCDFPGCIRTEGFSTLRGVHRHKWSTHREERANTKYYRCFVPDCRKNKCEWNRADNFRRHMKAVHNMVPGDDNLHFYLFREIASPSAELAGLGSVGNDLRRDASHIDNWPASNLRPTLQDIQEQLPIYPSKLSYAGHQQMDGISQGQSSYQNLPATAGPNMAPSSYFPPISQHLEPYPAFMNPLGLQDASGNQIYDTTLDLAHVDGAHYMPRRSLSPYPQSPLRAVHPEDPAYPEARPAIDTERHSPVDGGFEGDFLEDEQEKVALPTGEVHKHNDSQLSLSHILDEAPESSLSIGDVTNKNRQWAITTKDDKMHLPQPLKKQKSIEDIVPPIISGLYEPPPDAAVFPPIALEDNEGFSNMHPQKEFTTNVLPNIEQDTNQRAAPAPQQDQIATSEADKGLAKVKGKAAKPQWNLSEETRDLPFDVNISQEDTVADSGYVSACAAKSINDPKYYEKLRKHGTMGKSEATNRLTVDQRTEYTSSTLPQGSDYVGDLCHDIYMKLKNELQKHTHHRGRIELPGCLPDLIKAFSIRIGLDRSEPSRAYIMHFLHSNHGKIKAGLEQLCQQREASPEPCPKDKHDKGMTVLDRMALWNRKENEEPSLDFFKDDGLFEGVGDIEEEDITANTQMATYRNFVLSSTGYQWFIESLRKQLSLDSGPDDLTEARSCRLIRQSIMSRITSGIISRHRAPEIRRARFRIQLRPDVLHRLQEEPLVHWLTLTSSAPNIVQALQLHDYLDQTWSSGGLRLVEIIQQACCGESGAINTDDFDDSTGISAQLEKLEHSELCNLLVTVSGSRYSISECGEQLAWLGAAFQRPIDGNSIANCTCSIETQHEEEWSIHYSLDNVLQNMGATETQTAPMFHASTITQGFPTQKRPPLFPGLELGLTLMLRCIDAPNSYSSLVFENGQIVFKGFCHTLELVKHSQNVLLWHIVHLSSTSCSFSECPSRNQNDTSHFDSRLQIESLVRQSRHIIANSEYLGVPVANPGFPMERKIAQAYANTEVSCTEMREDRSPPLSVMEDRSSAMDSSGDSLDSELLSISSEASDCLKNVDLEGSLASTIDQISHRIFVEYKGSRGCRSRPQCRPEGNFGRGGNSSSSPNSSNQAEHRATFRSNGIGVRQSVKRSRPQDDKDEDWDDDGFRRPPRPTKRPKRSPSRPRGRILACPFWKLDSRTHRHCFRMKCTRIADVKYHLSRKHRQPAPEYCQRCWIAFDDEVHKVTHLKDESGQSCRYNPGARPVGIDNTMAAALHKKSNPKHSTEDQWFTIWEIVFPDHPRPSSPYINDSLSEETTQLIERIVNQWPSILANELGEAGGLADSNEMGRLAREHLIRMTLARLSDEFSAEQAQIQPAISSSDHQSPEGRASSSSNRADSAIEIGSYQSSGQLSAGPSGEASQSIPGPAIQIETASMVRSQRGVMPNRRESYIPPVNQNSFTADYDQQQVSMPPSTTPSRSAVPDLPNMQMTDVFGADLWFGTDFIDDTLQLPTVDTSRNLLGNSSEAGKNASWQSLGTHANGWSMPEN